MSKRYYGVAIRAYLAELVNYQEEMALAARNIRTAFLAEHVPVEASSEVYRAASRFALVAAAGESASEITGWQRGEAMSAAVKMFKVWLDGRGTKGGSDTEAAIKQVKAFLEAHGSSRFQSVNDDFAKINNRVGFKRTNAQEQTEYLILPEAFRKEICSGYDAQSVAKTLAERGYLRRGDGKNLLCRETLPEIGRPRVYVLLPTLLSAEVL
jgi:putative DNA primase/helicase